MINRWFPLAGAVILLCGLLLGPVESSAADLSRDSLSIQKALVAPSTKEALVTTHCEKFTLTAFPGPPPGQVGSSYRYQIKTNKPGISPAYKLIAGRLPSGLKVNTKGLIYGVPQKPGTFTFTVQAALNCATFANRVSTKFSLIIRPSKIALSVKSRPHELAIATGKETAHTVEYLFTYSGSDSLGLYSSEGRFVINKMVAGKVSKPLAVPLKHSPGKAIEALVVPRAVIRIAQKQNTRQIRYVRTFKVKDGSVSAQAAVRITIAPMPKMSIQSLILFFKSETVPSRTKLSQKSKATIAVNQVPPPLYAELLLNRPGEFEAFWQIDGKPVGRPKPYTASGLRMVVPYPDKAPSLAKLPPGEHHIQFVIKTPAIKIPASQAVLVVEAQTVKQLPSFLSGQIVVVTRDTPVGRSTLNRLRKKYRLKTIETVSFKTLRQTATVFGTHDEVMALVKQIRKERGVVQVQPNHLFRTMADPQNDLQQVYAALNLSAVHQHYQGAGVSVAIVDTGVDIRHPDLKQRVVKHANLIRNNPYRAEIHGTALAGVLAASINNMGITGIAPRADLMALRACRQLSETDPEGSCTTISISKAIDMAIESKAQIVNMSFGSSATDRLMMQLLETGAQNGVLFVAPVGNKAGRKTVPFPASHSKVLAVGGLDATGALYPNAALAQAADVCAPASNILTTVPGKGHNFLSGTSISAAIVSGILAVAKEKNKYLNMHTLPDYEGDLCRWQERLINRTVCNTDSH